MEKENYGDYAIVVADGNDLSIVARFEKYGDAENFLDGFEIVLKICNIDGVIARIVEVPALR